MTEEQAERLLQALEDIKRTLQIMASRIDDVSSNIRNK